MAEYIPNQPVYFGDQEECNTDEYDYNQLVDNGDSTQFQFKIDKCEDAIDRVTNGDFEGNIDDWFADAEFVYSNGMICKTAGTTLDAKSINQYCLVKDGYFVVEIDVYSLAGGTIDVYFKENKVGVITSAGTYRFFGKCINEEGGPNYLALVTQDNASVCIDSVHAYEIKRDFVVAVYKKDGTLMGEITFAQDPEKFIFYKDTVTVTVYWQDQEAENDCYYLCVLDPCRNTNGQNYPAKILNCSFDTDTVWSHLGWDYFTGNLQILISSPLNPHVPVTQTNVFERFDVDYYITVDVELTGSAKLDVKFGSNLIETIAATGIYNLVGKAETTFDLILEGYITGAGGTIKLNSACPTKIIYGNADIVNGTFDDDFGNWESEWFIYSPSLGDNRADAEVTSGTPTKELIQRNVFDSLSKEYGIRVRVFLPPSGRAVIDVYFGTSLIQTLSFSGPVEIKTYDIYGYPVGNLDLKFVARYISSSGDTVEILDVTPIIRESEYECDFVSNMFKVSDLSQACTLLINACNDDDGMGFVFGGSGFSPRIRLNAKLKQAKYDGTKERYEDSKGDRKNVFYKRRKSKILATDLEPEYVHDFLSTLVGYDKFYINGSEPYVCDDEEYNVEYPDEMDYHGKVRLLIGPKVQDVKNINYTDVENNCAVTDNLLVQADDPNSLITQTDGSGISING